MAKYENYCVYELRNFAREVGVKAPTTKTKFEIINEIRRIEKGEIKPYIPKVRVGRPFKNIKFENKKQFIEDCMIMLENFCFDLLRVIKKELTTFIEDLPKVLESKKKN